MPRANLTDRALKSYKPTEEPVEYWDTVHKGFGVRVNPTGKKTFFVRYSFAGRRRRVMLGPYPYLKLHEAREKAKEVIGQVVRGIDPQAKDEGITFAELAEHYLELHAKRKKRSWREDERMIRRELLPEWESLRVKEIQRRDLIPILDRIMDRGAPTTANRTRALVSKIFNFGIERHPKKPDRPISWPCEAALRAGGGEVVCAKCSAVAELVGQPWKRRGSGCQDQESSVRILLLFICLWSVDARFEAPPRRALARGGP